MKKEKSAVLLTRRLELRSFHEADRGSVIAILRDDTVKKTYMLPDFPDDAAAGKLFERLMMLSNDKTRFLYAISLDGRAIGFLNDVEIGEDGIEVGYVIAPQEQNRGYASESLTAAIAELFRMGYRLVSAGFFEENPASGRVMEKSGMHRVERTDEIEYRGATHHCIYYEIEK